MNSIKAITEELKGVEREKEILSLLAQNKRKEATELMVDDVCSTEYIFSIRHDEKTEMWIYKNGIYIPQGRSYITEYCRKILGDAFTTNLSNQVIAKIEADTFIESKKFFSNNIIAEVPLQNGLFNIFTKKLNEFDPKKIFFGKIPITYDPSKKCPVIIKHFETVLKNKEEDIKVMQELFGYLLLKELKIEKAIMFSGGRNGKGKTLELMKQFLGIENCSSISLEQIENDHFILSEFFGKMANLTGELNKTAMSNTGTFKDLTGRDLLTAPRKFLPPIYFTNYAKLIFACNELPMTYDLTLAFWERWVYLEFPYTFKTKEEIKSFPEEDRKGMKVIDPDIISKLSTPSELSGCLNWALIGLDRLLKQKNFSDTKTSEDVKVWWRRKSNSFNAFCMDCLEDNYNGKIVKAELRKGYNLYCKKNGVDGTSDKAIKTILSKEFGVSDEYITNADGNRVYTWVGLKFKDSVQSVQDEQGFSTYSEKQIQPLDRKQAHNLHTLHNEQVEQGNSETNQKIDGYNVIEEEVVEETHKKPSDDDLIAFIEEKGNKGYSTLKFSKKYGEERLNRLLRVGDIYENPKNTLRVK